MTLYTIHTYRNTLKPGIRNQSGPGLVHETKERALDAAKGNEKDYLSIAVHMEMPILRCDTCREQGIAMSALPHASGKDLCQTHRDEFEKNN